MRPEDGAYDLVVMGTWVDSEPGHGTTFKIYLPRAEFVERFAVAVRVMCQPLRGE